MVGANNNNDPNLLIEAQQLLPTREEQAINLQLHRHDILCIIGPNSSRQSHYLRTLAGVSPPQQGELRLFGISLKELDRKSWLEQRQQIGFVARSAPILSVLPALDNVMLPLLYHKRMSQDEARIKAEQLIAETGYKGDLNALPSYLTQQQRLQLAIARATILGPDVLFVEEPFASLSLAEQQSIFQYLVNGSEQHALVLTTQNLHLVKNSATQILFIGEKQVFNFSNWITLIESNDEEVEEYLALYQQQYQLT